MQQEFPFAPLGANQITVASTVLLAMNGAAQQVTIPLVSSNGGTMRIVNVGTALVFWMYGNLAVAATGAATGVPVAAGTTASFMVPGGTTQLSFFGAAGSTVYVTIGDGR